MAQVSMYIPDYVAGGNKCPSCARPPEIVFITDSLIHINCPFCTWAQLARAVFGIEPWELPFDVEQTHSAHPY